MLLAAALLALSQAAGTLPASSAPAAAGDTPARARQSRLFALPDNAVAYVPASAGQRPPLLVLLHGAGHRQLEMVQHFEAEADARGIVLLAPDSRAVTWDTVAIAQEPLSSESPLGREQSLRFGRSRDADRVEAAIANLAKTVAIDRARTVLAGFSDGATFALAMGLAKDHSFAAVIAWSPGIAIATERPASGRRVFVSHGRTDPVLSFATTCGEIVPLLRSEGAAVTFVPFEGGHDAPVWLKDAFLDAVFGRVPGSQARPLPAEVERCTAAGTAGRETGGG